MKYIVVSPVMRSGEDITEDCVDFSWIVSGPNFSGQHGGSHLESQKAPWLLPELQLCCCLIWRREKPYLQKPPCLCGNDFWFIVFQFIIIISLSERGDIH